MCLFNALFDFVFQSKKTYYFFCSIGFEFDLVLFCFVSHSSFMDVWLFASIWEWVSDCTESDFTVGFLTSSFKKNFESYRSCCAQRNRYQNKKNQHNFLFRNGTICFAFFGSGKYCKQEAIHYDIVCHMRSEFAAFLSLTQSQTLRSTKCTSTANICSILSCELFSHMIVRRTK